MECGECSVVGERGITFFIYLVVIIDDIFGVVAVGVVSECAKSGMAVSVIVFAAACRRTADTFAIDTRTFGDILLDILG